MSQLPDNYLVTVALLKENLCMPEFGQQAAAQLQSPDYQGIEFAQQAAAQLQPLLIMLHLKRINPEINE